MLNFIFYPFEKIEDRLEILPVLKKHFE